MGKTAVKGGGQKRKKAAVLLFSFLLPIAVMLIVYRLPLIVWGLDSLVHQRLWRCLPRKVFADSF